MKKKSRADLTPSPSPLQDEGKRSETSPLAPLHKWRGEEKDLTPSPCPISRGEPKRGDGAKEESAFVASTTQKETEEKAAEKPSRVPVDPIPFKTWKIKKLPPDLKEQLDKMLSEGTMHSYRQLSKWLGENGFQISHAAIHKYGQKFEHKLQAIRLATEQARIVCEEFKGDDSQIQSALLRLVQTQLFNVLSATHGEGSKGVIDGPVAQVNLGALARSVSGLVKAETEHRKWVEHMRAGVAAAEKKVEEAREKGLSKNAADQIKAVLLEI